MFAHPQTVHRDRKPQVPSPHNPARTMPAPTWDDATTIDLDDAWVGDMSISASRDPARSNTTASSSLYCPPDSDVRRGDRIRAVGRTYTVLAVPALPFNPFTGWAPPIEIPVEEVHDA